MSGGISPTGVGSAFFYPNDPGGGPGIVPLLDADPGNVNAPIIFEPPFGFTNNTLEVMLIVTGANQNWGGCQVWVSLDGTTYGQAGTIFQGGIQGLLTATFPSHTDPDAVDTLSVDVTESNAQLIPYTVNDADHFVSLCYCDHELIAFTGATLTSAFHYNLGTYIRRGCYGSTISSHASGSQFGQITSTTFQQTFLKSYIGTTVHFKFPSFNNLQGGLQDLSVCTDYTYTLTGIGQGPNWYQSISVGSRFIDMVPDTWDGNYEIFDVQSPGSLAFGANMEFSPLPGCEVAPLVDTTLTLQSISGGVATTRGTLFIPASSLAGTWTNSAFTVPVGDRVRLYAPPNVDQKISGLFGTIVGILT